MTTAAVETPSKKSFSERMLDGIEKTGNKVPHPVIMFLYLIAFIAVLSAVLAAFDVSVTEDVAIPVNKAELQRVQDALGGSVVPYDTVSGEILEVPDVIIEEQTFDVKSLLAIDGIRFVFSSFVNNFAGFAVVAVTFIAMAGVGVAEKAGMMAALIRKLVKVAPPKLIAFFIVLVGVLSSVASDAGYLILIPLAAAAFVTVNRHPLAGLAAAFAGVACVFAVNVLITPVDSMLTEITNEAIGPNGKPLEITANLYFGIVSSIVMAIVAVIVTQRIVEPRLGKWDPSLGDPAFQGAAGDGDEAAQAAAEARGLKFALYALLVVGVLLLLMTVPSGAPLRDATTGDLIGNTPFMASLIFIISLTFLICGIAFGKGAKTISGSGDVINAVTATFAGLSGLVFMLLMISQFIAFFNYTNLPRVAAVEMAQLLERAGLGALPLLIGLILVIVLLDIIIPGVVPKWAIFAPVFIPIFDRLGVAPQTVLAAYRVGDSPMNSVTPLMVYLPFIVTVAQRYDKKAGLGTIISLMIPYVFAILGAWLLLFTAWWILDIPLGPGSPVSM
ncbi:MAG: AbgT family transporter [Actinobacteria bacterium]|nr:AbgT family transporter [Actinomycetota bacterium]